MLALVHQVISEPKNARCEQEPRNLLAEHVKTH